MFHFEKTMVFVEDLYLFGFIFTLVVTIFFLIAYISDWIDRD